MTETLLHIRNLSISFGGLMVLNGLNLEMKSGEILGLMGPNGSGKSTLFNCIGGQYQADRGQIFWQNQDISGLRPDQIAKQGIARTFQQPQLFASLSVREHALIARERHWAQSGVAAIFPFGAKRKRLQDRKGKSWVDHCFEILALNEVATAKVSDLPYGWQKRVELLRALATEPTLLLLDEPAAGLSDMERTEWLTMIKRVKEENENELSILIIEHQTELLRSLADRVGVMNEGRLIALGTFEAIAKDEKVREAYWGGD